MLRLLSRRDSFLAQGEWIGVAALGCLAFVSASAQPVGAGAKTGQAAPPPITTPSIQATKTPAPGAASLPLLPASSTAASSDKSTDPVARSLAGFGLLLTAASFCFTLIKAKRDRRLSVEDDFWFRKIVAPSAIEPILKSVAELLNGLPPAAENEERHREYAAKVTTEILRLSTQAHLLALFEQDMPDILKEALRDVEDNILSYPNKDHQVLAGEVWARLTGCFDSFRKKQLKR